MKYNLIKTIIYKFYIITIPAPISIALWFPYPWFFYNSSINKVESLLSGSSNYSKPPNTPLIVASVLLLIIKLN